MAEKNLRNSADYCGSAYGGEIMERIIIFLVSFFAAVLGSMGLGGGFVLLIYLTAFAGVDQLQAQGINLLFFLPIAATSLLLHAKNKLILWKEAGISVLFGIPGVFLGYFLTDRLGSDFIAWGFTFIVLFTGIRELFSKKE